MPNLKPMPTQLTGAEFLASRMRAGLFDEQRCGKTGAAIIAADMVLARRIVVVTTASGRAVWRKAFHDWQTIDRAISIFGADKRCDGDVIILSWESVAKFTPPFDPDLIVLDECHRVKNIAAKTTMAVYGKPVADGERMNTAGALVQPRHRVWHLTGTPAPHDPGDLWTTLRASAPELLAANPEKSWPNVTRFDDFRSRYCIVRMKQISAWTRIPVVVGGRNEAELYERIKGFYLRRTQSDIGIRPPSFDAFPLVVSQAQRNRIDAEFPDQRAILAAAETGDTKNVEMELGRLRRLTGVIKAEAVIKAVKDEMEDGLDKLVLMFWHTEVGESLLAGLSKYGAVLVDGATPTKAREANIRRFQIDSRCRVFIGQIQACAEAIDLSASSEMWVVEASFTPAMMAQVAMRIINVNQTRNCFVRVCTLAGTIDDAIQASLVRLWASIKQVVK